MLRFLTASIGVGLAAVTLAAGVLLANAGHAWEAAAFIALTVASLLLTAVGVNSRYLD